MMVLYLPPNFTTVQHASVIPYVKLSIIFIHTIFASANTAIPAGHSSLQCSNVWGRGIYSHNALPAYYCYRYSLWYHLCACSHSQMGGQPMGHCQVSLPETGPVSSRPLEVGFAHIFSQGVPSIFIISGDICGCTSLSSLRQLQHHQTSTQFSRASDIKMPSTYATLIVYLRNK